MASSTSRQSDEEIPVEELQSYEEIPLEEGQSDEEISLRIFTTVQDFHKLRDQCLAEKRLFEDPTFDEVSSNIFCSKERFENLEWKRPTELTDDPHLFNEVSRFDAVQGDLANCWFAAAVANLTLHLSVFHKVVPQDQGFKSSEKYAGIFYFRFWQYGKWINVVVDDRLPTIKNQLLFLQSKDENEFWSALLEKAYAKFHGSYEALDRGFALEALIDFTGGISERYDLKAATSVPNLFSIMLKAHEKKSLMTCYIRLGSSAQLKSGLIKNHEYSLTDVKLLDITTPCVSGQQQLVRIRNPWGSREWKGPWSDASPEWQSIPNDEKEKLGLVFETDGEFWMTFSDFVKYFENVDMCHLGPEAFTDTPDHERWNIKSFSGSWIKGATAGGRSRNNTFHNNPQYRIQLEDPDDDDKDNTCTLLVSLIQKYRRTRKDKYIKMGFVIYYLKNPNTTQGHLSANFFKSNQIFARAKFFSGREISKRFKFATGTYCVIPCTYLPNKEADFLLRIYSEKKSDMKENDDQVSVRRADDASVRRADANVVKLLVKLNETFCRIAGPGLTVDANELKEVFDFVLKTEYDFPGFGIDLYHGMIAMMDSDRLGKLGFEEVKELWINVATWRAVFKLYEKNNSEFLSSFEMRSALTSAGYQVNWHILEVLTLRYANKNDEVSFENFIMCAVKLKKMIEAFKEKNTQERNEAIFNITEWLTLTMYA